MRRDAMAMVVAAGEEGVILDGVWRGPRQGKKISDGKSGLPENLPLPIVSEKRIPTKFRIFWFQNSKIQKKIIKNENRIFRPDFVAFRSDFGAFRSENIVLAM